MVDKTLLDDLTKSLPEETRRKVRELLLRSRIVNPDDPIFELMVILGIWGQYYQSIPAAMNEAGKAADARVKTLVDALMSGIESVRLYSEQASQTIAEAPKALLAKFPADSLAAQIAEKIDKQFDATRLMVLQRELEALRATIGRVVVGEHGKGGLAAQLEEGLARLQECADQMVVSDLIPNRWWRDLGFLFCGALIAAGTIWLFAVHPLQVQFRKFFDRIDSPVPVSDSERR